MLTLEGQYLPPVIVRRMSMLDIEHRIKSGSHQLALQHTVAATAQTTLVVLRVLAWCRGALAHRRVGVRMKAFQSPRPLLGVPIC